MVNGKLCLPAQFPLHHSALVQRPQQIRLSISHSLTHEEHSEILKALHLEQRRFLTESLGLGALTLIPALSPSPSLIVMKVTA